MTTANDELGVSGWDPEKDPQWLLFKKRFDLRIRTWVKDHPDREPLPLYVAPDGSYQWKTRSERRRAKR